MQGQTVGQLSIDKDENYHFEYDENWIEKGFAISPHLSFNSQYTSSTIKRFLENLIPEGEGLDDIATFARISKNNTFAMVHTIGYDTAGALMFGENSEEAKAIFREITSKELSERIEQIESKSIGNEKAVRAVASANGANSIAILVPCHRIIGSNGDLVGYAGGLDVKRKLLAIENNLFT